MTRVIGSADEFWRLRMTRVDTTDDLDFEWHDDILYRRPNVRHANEIELWTVEAVQLADFEVIVRIASFAEREEADSFYQRAKDDLAELTKSQFEDAYFADSSEAANDASDDEDQAEVW